MDNLTAILTAIKKYNRIIIHRHQRPDPDAIGSQTGLAEILRSSFPHKEIYMVGKDIPSFDWIGSMDEIDGDEYHNALVIVIDTANTPRIDDRRYNNGDFLIKIDHHPNDEPYGDLMWVQPDASSCSELVYDFYNQFADQLTLPESAAHALYAGIVGDTGRFLYPATTSHTLAVAGALMEHGAQAAKISQRENEITFEMARLSAYVYNHLSINAHGVGQVKLSNEELKDYGLTEATTSAVVPLPGQIHTVLAWAIFVQQEDGEYRARLRSKGPAINEVAKQHRGGGHPLASGAKAADDAECEQIIADLDQVCRQYLEKEK